MIYYVNDIEVNYIEDAIEIKRLAGTKFSLIDRDTVYIENKHDTSNYNSCKAPFSTFVSFNLAVASRWY